MSLSLVQTKHFYGGSISWQAVSPSITNTGTVTIKLQQTYSWANYIWPCLSMTGPPTDQLVCLTGCVSTTTGILVEGTCISYDFELNVTTSENTNSITYALGAQVVLAYQNANWIALVAGLQSWSLATYINLAVRTDNGRINSSPTTSMTPLVIVPVNTPQILRIPMMDIDNDIVKCRWANGSAIVASTSISECGGVCQDIPGAQLYSTSNLDNNCTLVFDTTLVGYYVVAIQIEDFMPSNPNSSPLSSIPLQFLVNSVQLTCNVPTIIGELTNGAIIQVQANVTFSVSIIAEIGCNDSTINSFLTVILPLGMASTSSIIQLSSTLYSTIFTWTPSMNQIGTTQIYCTIAIDSNSLQSTQYCLNFVVMVTTTTTTTSTSTSTSSSSTSTTTSTSTSSTSTTSTSSTSTSTTTTVLTTTIYKQSTNLNLLLGLILGLGLPLCLLLSLLSCCCCCPRWCAQSFWGKIRQKFWQEKAFICHLCRGRHTYQMSNTNETTNDDARSYRQQYINSDNSTYRLTSSSIGPVNLNSLTSTRTTFLSSVSNNITPIAYTSSVISFSEQTPTGLNNGSHLIRAYSHQLSANNYR